MPERCCTVCDETDPPPKLCAGCNKAWYCSRECQKSHWVFHIFDCNPSRPINSADYLALAVIKDTFPENPQTCEDYGFNKVDPAQASKLLGLYAGLLSSAILNVKPLTLHRWRLEGTLIENIKREYERPPERNRGEYYPWFLQNQDVLRSGGAEENDSRNQARVDDELRRAWSFIGKPPDTSIGEILQWSQALPKHHNHCFALYVHALSNTRLSPDSDLWISFGYCACSSPWDEDELTQSYTKLIHSCTFDEFCTAYTSSSLFALFQARNVDLCISNLESLGLAPSTPNPQIIDVLSGSPYRNKSVWDLKQYIRNKIIHGRDNVSIRPIPSISADYGFHRCQNREDGKLLFDIYKKYFNSSDSPLKLHHACIQGRLFEFFEVDVKIQLRPKNDYKRLLQNPYPLEPGPSSAVAGITLVDREEAVAQVRKVFPRAKVSVV